MLRVGLTGDLGSGKSTVARMLAERGAVVVSADEIGRAMMRPGEPVFRAIVQHFGKEVLSPDGTLNRQELARLAFEGGRAEELNALVHPPVIAEQARLARELEQQQPEAVFVVESALIFTTAYQDGDQPWRKRCDRIVMVTAPEEQKIARFLARAAAGRVLDQAEQAALEADARRRLAAQAPSHAFAEECLVLANDAGLAQLAAGVDEVWRELQQALRAK